MDCKDNTKISDNAPSQPEKYPTISNNDLVSVSDILNNKNNKLTTSTTKMRLSESASHKPQGKESPSGEKSYKSFQIFQKFFV